MKHTLFVLSIVFIFKQQYKTMFMFDVFKGLGSVWIAFVCSLVLGDIVICIKCTFCEKEKVAETFYDIHENYWKKHNTLHTHEEKKQLTQTTFDAFIKIIESKDDFDINEPDNHGVLLIEYVLTMYDSLEYVKKLIEMGADPTKTGKNEIPMVSWIAKMANCETYNYFIEKDYHNVTVLPKYNIFLQCVGANSSTLQQKHDFLKMLKDNGRTLDINELQTYLGYPLITYFSRKIASDVNLTNNYKLVLDTMKIILSFGIDIDEVGKDGLTELIVSVKHNLYNRTKLFVDLGANLFAVDEMGLCACDIASRFEHFHIQRYLTSTMFVNLTTEINKLKKINNELKLEFDEFKSKFSGAIIEC